MQEAEGRVRRDAGGRAGRPIVRPITAALLLALAGACAGAPGYPPRPHPSAIPAGSPLASPTLDPGDAWLRHHLVTGDAAAAVAQLQGGRAPRDALVRDLQLGLALRAAERWAESNAAFERAEVEAERRFSRSVSQAVGTLLVNDAVVSYSPPPAEMTMIPFYRMLNYFALGEPGEARVEARRATAYLERLRGQDGEPCVGEGMVQYLAGLAFAAGGERADALVALRQAERAYDACAGEGEQPPAGLGEALHRAALAAGVGEVADSAALRYRLAPPAADAAAGEVVVVLETGWVAHRAGDALHVPIWDVDLAGVGRDDDAAIAAAAARISARVLESTVERARWGSAAGDHPAVQVAAALDGAYLMRLAWPVFRQDAEGPLAVRLRVDDVVADSADAATNLSALLVRRWERQRAAALARMVGRGLAKYLLTREAERGAERRGGEAAGWLVGRLANLAGNRLERADTRSWSLLPDRVSLVRLRLPPGEHRLTVELSDGSRTVDLGTVRVEAGEMRIVARRLWDAAEGAPLAAAGR